MASEWESQVQITRTELAKLGPKAVKILEERLQGRTSENGVELQAALEILDRLGVTSDRVPSAKAAAAASQIPPSSSQRTLR